MSGSGGTVIRQWWQTVTQGGRVRAQRCANVRATGLASRHRERGVRRRRPGHPEGVAGDVRARACRAVGGGGGQQPRESSQVVSRAGTRVLKRGGWRAIREYRSSATSDPVGPRYTTPGTAERGAAISPIGLLCGRSSP